MATVTTIDARPVSVNLTLYAGDDVNLSIAVTDAAGTAADLTGFTAKAQIRATADAPTAKDFVATADPAGTVTLILPSAETTDMPAKGVWDCQITSGTGAVTTLCGGTVTTTPEVTR